MSAREELQKTINNIQEKIKEKGRYMVKLIMEYKDFYTKENNKYIKKFQNICMERIDYLSNIKDESKRTMYKDTERILENLFKENDELVRNLESSLNALKSFLLKDLSNIFPKGNESTSKGENSNKNKLVIKSTDDCGKAKGILNSKEGENLTILDINKITADDFNYLFGDNLKKKEEDNDEKKDNDEEIIKIRKLKFKKSILLNINIGDYFPNIENLSISDCKIGYEVYPKIHFNNITKLSLEGIELVNENFEDLIIYLLKDQSGDYIGKNLKYLSVKNNRISRILFPANIEDINDKRDIRNNFTNLTFLNLSGNNLFDYYIDAKKKPIFKEVKILDLTGNNITSPLIIKNLIQTKEKDCLILAAKNIGVIKNKKMRNFYCNYLKTKLEENKNTESYIKSLVFEGVFGMGNKNLLLELKLNNFENTLVELNLSFNSLTGEEVMQILDKNKKMINLKRLNLSSNIITEEFFAKFVENKYYENYKNLKLLNLSCNPINFSEAKTYKDFISNCKNLEFLILKNTFIGEHMNHYMKNKIIRFTAEKKGQKFGNPDKIMIEMENFIDKERFLKNHSKVYITISFIIKPKYLAYINKYFPYLLERIKLEE